MEAREDAVDALVPDWKAKGLSDELIATLELSKRTARLAAILEQAVKEEMAELGLAYTEFDILAALYRGGPPYRLTPSELSRSLFLTSGGTSNVLQRLTASGLVERTANPGDARSRWVQLTDKGQQTARTAVDASSRVHQEVMASVPDEAVRRAADALRDVLLPLGRRRYR